MQLSIGSTVIHSCFDFALLCSVCGLKNSHFLNQSEVKQKLIAVLSISTTAGKKRRLSRSEKSATFPLN